MRPKADVSGPVLALKGTYEGFWDGGVPSRAPDIARRPSGSYQKIIHSDVNRGTDLVEQFFVRVEVTQELSLLVTKISLYFDR